VSGARYEVEYTDEFRRWWAVLSATEQDVVIAAVGLLERLGPQLRYPHSSSVRTSRYRHMRELRMQFRGRPYRVLYAFDPRRVALLLIGGDKTGDDRWYHRFVPLADRLYAEHLEAIRGRGPMKQKG
jgi:hypothetical protein